MASEDCPKCEECVKGAPAYMMTFGDLMSLLLTFFVLLLSQASFEPTKFALTMQSIQGAFGIMESFPTVAVMPIVKIPKKTGDEQKKKQSLQDAQKIEQTIESKQLDDAVKVKVTEEGIHILLNDPVAFPSGSDQLKQSGASILKDISAIIKQNEDLKIRVEGHTDDVPIKTKRFDSNWELSSARALSVVKMLSQQTGINPAFMSGVGFGEHRPVVPNSDKNNRAQNRRIEIFVDYIEK
jgi:chemotaxis protein MotB